MEHRIFRMIPRFKNKRLISIGLLTVLITGPLPVGADAYLDALHNEAGKLEYLDESRSSNAITTRKNSISTETQHALKSVAAFEKYFQTQDSATASIYFRLSTQHRLRVYHRFKSSRDFSLAKKMTIELFNQEQQNL